MARWRSPSPIVIPTAVSERKPALAAAIGKRHRSAVEWVEGSSRANRLRRRARPTLQLTLDRLQSAVEGSPHSHQAENSWRPRIFSGQPRVTRSIHRRFRGNRSGSGPSLRSGRAPGCPYRKHRPFPALRYLAVPGYRLRAGQRGPPSDAGFGNGNAGPWKGPAFARHMPCTTHAVIGSAIAAMEPIAGWAPACLRTSAS